MNEIRERLLRALAPASIALAGCVGGGEFRLVDGEYPGELRAPDALPHAVMWRQNVTAHWRDDRGQEASRGFGAVLQCGRGELTIVGLDPTNRIGFSIVHDGEAIELENHMPREFPFDPRFVLLDAQRAFYPWLDATPLSASGVDGAREGVVDDEIVREIRTGGRLVERTFERRDGDPAGLVHVEYRWATGDVDVPREVTLTNGWFGYRLEIETYEARRLDVPVSAAGSEAP